MSQSILYYPNINIKDGAWLRGAALYWDEVCSIVPSSDSKLSRELLCMEEHGMYRRIHPGEVFWSGQSEEFMQKVRKRFIKARKKESKKENVHMDDGYSFVHIEKFPTDFGEMLNEIEVPYHQYDNWIEMDEIFSDIYMRTLAEYITKNDREDMVLGTDKKSKLNDIYKPTSWKKERDLMISLKLVQCLPVPSLETDFGKIIKFKEKRRDEFLELREKISEVEKRISHSESEKEFKSVITAFQESWQKEISEAELLFKGDGIGFVLDNLEAYITNMGSVAGILGLVESCKDGLVSPTLVKLAVGMTGCITLGQQYKRYRKKVREQQDSGFAYIIGAAKKNIIKKK